MKVLVALLTCLSVLGNGQIYYVTQSGAGTRSGADLSNAWSVSDFNNTSTWSATDNASLIDPGDWVIFDGTITTPIVCRGNGTINLPISLSLTNAVIATISSTLAAFSFNGMDYIHAYGGQTADGISVPSVGSGSIGYIRFGTGSSAKSVGCQLIGFRSVNKTGSTLVTPTYSQNCTIRGLYLTNFLGLGIGGGAGWGNTANLTLEDSTFITVDGGTTVTTDCMKINGLTDSIIQRNFFSLRADKAGSDPHNDILQFHGNTGSDTNQRTGNIIIRNNWLEIRGAIRLPGVTTTDAFNNFFMHQHTRGYWKIYNNVFYSTGLSSPVGNGCNISRHRGAMDVEFYNNLFISLNGGLANQITLSPQNAAVSTLKIRNNIFFSDLTSGAPVVEGVSDLGTVILGPNAYTGWQYARQVLDSTGGHVGYIPKGSEAGAILVSVAQALFNNLSTTTEDFRFASNSVYVNLSADIPDADLSTVNTDARSTVYPPFTTATRTGVADLGPWEYIDGSEPVNVAPTFTEHPVSQSKQVGESVTFAVSATGIPAPTYQWYKGGVSISGQTNDTYTISSVSLSDSGTFYAVATNSEGSDQSDSAVLVVTPTPQPSVPAPGVGSGRRRAR